MTIAKNPRKKAVEKKARTDSKTEKQARRFITPPANGARDLVPVLIKFDRTFLKRLDAAASNRGLNRSAFVISTIGDKLTQLEL